MDIKAKIEELMEKIAADDGILEQFKKAPVKTVEELLGIDLPDEKIREIVAVLKAKLDMDAIDEKLDALKGRVEAAGLEEKLEGLKDGVDLDEVKDIAGALGGLFGKKN
jgi:hypothetical protein